MIRFIRPVPVLVGWTVFLWLSRLRNVLSDDELSLWDRTWRIAVVVGFVGLAAAAGWAWGTRARDRGRARRLVVALCAWTVLFWIVRGGGIIIDDHPLGFTLVHTVLMVVSIALAVWAWPRARAEEVAADTAR